MATGDRLRVVRVYHGGRDPAHRLRDRALLAAGVDLTLAIPKHWPAGSSPPAPVIEAGLTVIELPVRRAGDVNRHSYVAADAVHRLLSDIRPDLLDVHEEPVSLAMRQMLSLAPPGLRVVGYTAQNLDKRFPPPFAQHERRAYGRLAGLYPCSRQAASVAWGKGFRGNVRVLPLGHDPQEFRPGDQRLDGEIVMILAGRLVAEKGVADAVHALAAVRRQRPARLVFVGAGPALGEALATAQRLGIRAAVHIEPWLDHQDLAELYRRAHVVLTPSRSTPTWVEQFGRMIVEAQASGAVVVGYASGSIPEVAADTAALVPEGDAEALGSAVAAVLSDPARWRSLREAGLALAAGRTWEAVARDQVAFYEEVLHGPVRYPIAPADALSRSEAHRLFGPPATAGGVARPFADPLLRRLGRRQEAVGTALDAVTDAVRRLRYGRRTTDT